MADDPFAAEPFSAGAPESMEEYAPSYLPPPESVRVEASSGALVPGVMLGAVIAVVMGVVLYIAASAAYIYILYNCFIGIAIGWGLSTAPKRGFTNKGVLFLAALFCSLLPYVVFNAVLAAIWAEQQGISLNLASFIQFVILRAENETLFGKMSPGIVGSLIVWGIECAITLFYAWQRVVVGIMTRNIAEVPSEVTQFVVHLMANGSDRARIESELYNLGWIEPTDQARAIAAGQALVSLARHASNKT